MDVGPGIARGDVFLVDLNATLGTEIRKRPPCVVASPDDLNAHLGAAIVAPLTTGRHPYPFRVPCRFAGKAGAIVLDQVRAVDHERFGRRLGRVSPATLARALAALQEMFAP